MFWVGLAGLTFPGAIQAYRGRTREAAIFFLAPFVLLHLWSIVAVLLGLLAALAPGMKASLAGFIGSVAGFLKPGLASIGLIWGASFFRGMRWAWRYPREAETTISRWRGVSLGAAYIAFFGLTGHGVWKKTVDLTLSFGGKIEKTIVSAAGRAPKDSPKPLKPALWPADLGL